MRRSNRTPQHLRSRLLFIAIFEVPLVSSLQVMFNLANNLKAAGRNADAVEM
jgi:hypothetical protein